MPFILEHVTSLRKEISSLQKLKVRNTSKSSDSDIDQSVLEMRANRLEEIKKELAQMLKRPKDPVLWWEKTGRGRAA